MLSTEPIVSQCFGQEPISWLVVAALLSNKLENMSKTRARSQSNCRFVTHPAHSLSVGKNWSGVGFLTDLLSPSPPDRS